MLKKYLSRRGFTIVEVLVAFVIFSIMAAMIAVILNTTLIARQENIDLENEIAEQKSKYYLNTQDMTYSTKDGTIQLQFDGGGDIDIDYSIGNPNEETDDNKVELDYYIGDVDYDAMYKDNNGKNGDDGVGSVMSRLDSRIYGTSGIDEIYIKAKDLGAVSNGYRYEFDVMPVSTSLVGSQYEFHAQFKMVFPCTIVDYGYIHHISQQPINKEEGFSYNINLATPISDTLCIGSRMSKDDSMFKEASYKKIWVTLSSKIDVDDLNKIFGTSGSDQTTNKEGDYYLFTPYIEKVEQGEEGSHDDAGTIKHINIFGAFPKESTDDPSTSEATTEA